MTTTTDGFGPTELHYLELVETALLVAPRSARGRLLAAARRHLAERPPAATYVELVDDLGPPESYARQLMADRDVGPQPSLWRRTAARARSREVIGAAAIVAVLLVVAAWFGVRWYLEAPTLTNNCSGAFSDDGVPIEQSELPGESGTRIGFVEGAEVGLGACLSTTHPVEVLDLTVPGDGLFRPVRVEIATGGGEFAPFEPFTLVAHDEDGEPDPRSWWQVELFGVLDGCERHREGSSTSFDTGTVTYRFRGRTRTADLDLLTTYSFDGGPDEACPARSDQGGAG